MAPGDFQRLPAGRTIKGSPKGHDLGWNSTPAERAPNGPRWSLLFIHIATPDFLFCLYYSWETRDRPFPNFGGPPLSAPVLPRSCLNPLCRTPSGRPASPLPFRPPPGLEPCPPASHHHTKVLHPKRRQVKRNIGENVNMTGNNQEMACLSRVRVSRRQLRGRTPRFAGGDPVRCIGTGKRRYNHPVTDFLESSIGSVS